MALVPIFRHNRFGLAVRPRKAPPPPVLPAPEPVTVEARPPVEPEPAPEPDPPAPSLPRQRRAMIGGTPESVAARRALSDAAELWRDCPAAQCRRAKSCGGRLGAACLGEQRARIAPLLDAIRRSETGEPPRLAPPSPDPAFRGRPGRKTRARRGLT